jgi:hypothetical protein
VLHRRKSLPYHPNGLRLAAFDDQGDLQAAKVYYSVGGGFVVDEDATGQLLEIWQVTRECVAAGLAAAGVLPGGLKVRRRAPALARTLGAEGDRELHASEWLTLWAMAVNEEDAAGGRVVTAPTNGAAGIIPAVLHYYSEFVPSSAKHCADEDGIVRFLLAAGHRGADGAARRRHPPRLAGQGHHDHEGDRAGHVGQVQGDRPRRTRRQRHRMLSTRGRARTGLAPFGVVCPGSSLLRW